KICPRCLFYTKQGIANDFYSTFVEILIQMTSLSPSSQLITTSEKSRIRLAVALFYFGQGLRFASWASRIPTIKTALGLSEAQLGTILLMLPIGQLITMPLSAAMVNRFGSKLVLPIVAIIYALILIPIALSPNAWYLGASLFLYGVAGNLCNISVNTQGVLAEDMYGKSIMSSFHGAWSLAGFTGALIGLLMTNIGFNTLTHFLIIVALLIVNILWNRPYLLAEQNKTETGERKTKYKPDAVIIQLGIVAFLSMATEGAMFDWSGVYFHDVVKAPEELVILGYASFMIMM